MTGMDYENRHKLKPHDFAVLEDFGFEYAPVGFKFFNVESELDGLGLEQLDARITWCQMLREAQRGRSFYVTAENHTCEPGIFLTGHGPLVPLAASGRIGTAFDIYPDDVIGCDWLFTYPYVSGKINTIWTGICHGMSGYELHPPGLPIVAIPWHHIDRVLRNIREMPRIMPNHTAEREAVRRRGAERLGVEHII